MTKPQGEQTPSNFDARADSAALALRQTLIGQGRQVAQNAPVEVGPDGRPPAKLPPEGSYMRQAMEARRAEDVRPEPNPPSAQAPAQQPHTAGQSTQQSGDEPSPRAQRRIQELVDQLREKDEALQAAVQQSRMFGETLQQTQARLQAIEQQHQQMMQANLESLDPETRMQVLADAKMSEMFDKFEQRILGRIQPQLQQLSTKAVRDEMMSLADRYVAFDYDVHAPLIDRFRQRNPHCTVEQAFRAIAEPEELVTRQSASAVAVPPVVAPGNGSLANVRFAPRQEPQQSNPEAELVDEARRIRKLRESSDPAEQKEGYRLVHEHLKRRLQR